jgi:phage host-nuclease inhibitor protein Gam
LTGLGEENANLMKLEDLRRSEMKLKEDSKDENAEIKISDMTTQVEDLKIKLEDLTKEHEMLKQQK